jgi:hypothetical protein
MPASVRAELILLLEMILIGIGVIVVLTLLFLLYRRIRDRWVERRNVTTYEARFLTRREPTGPLKR